MTPFYYLGKIIILSLFLFPPTLIAQDIMSELPFMAEGSTAYYSFDNPTENRIENLTNPEMGASIQHANMVAGKQNSALEFNDSNSMVLMDSLPYSEAFTIMAWLKPYSYGKSPNAMLVFEKCMSFYMNIISQDGRLEKKRGYIRCGGHFATDQGEKGWEYINSADSVPLNEWTHAAVTFHEGSFKLYVNGQLVNEKQIRPTLMDSELPSTWGAKYNPKFDGFDGWFHGIIDESFLFSRALSADEIKKYYTYSSK